MMGRPDYYLHRLTHSYAPKNSTVFYEKNCNILFIFLLVHLNAHHMLSQVVVYPTTELHSVVFPD